MLSRIEVPNPLPVHHLVNRCSSSITLEKFCHKIQMKHATHIFEPSAAKYGLIILQKLPNENFLEIPEFMVTVTVNQ